jgi:hypothetical protein
MAAVDPRAVLAPFRGSRVWYCPNPGNAGDSLIAVATIAQFEALGIEWRYVGPDEPRDLRGEVVLYGGGGNLTPNYADAAAFLRRHNGRAARLVLLPHTVQGHEDLLGALGRGVDVVCREPVSYAHVRAAARGGAEVRLSHDLALTLDPSRVLGPRRPALLALLGVPASIRLRLLRHRLRHRIVHARHGRPGVLNCFRRDAERTPGPVPPDNIDVSRVFAFGVTRHALAAVYGFLSFLDRFDEVHTNRLHACIGAALLGKRVFFHANASFKCRAMYEHSLRDRFPDVTWSGPPTAAADPAAASGR